MLARHVGWCAREVANTTAAASRKLTGHMRCWATVGQLTCWTSLCTCDWFVIPSRMPTGHTSCCTAALLCPALPPLTCDALTHHSIVSSVSRYVHSAVYSRSAVICTMPARRHSRRAWVKQAHTAGTCWSASAGLRHTATTGDLRPVTHPCLTHQPIHAHTWYTGVCACTQLPSLSACILTGK